MIKGISHIGGLVNDYGQKYYNYKIVMKVNRNKELRQILNKYPSQYKNDFLMIEAVVDEKNDKKAIGYFINNIEVGVKDENLGVFTTLAKVMNGLKTRKKNPQVFFDKNDYFAYKDMLMPDYLSSSKPRKYLFENIKDINLIKDVADLFMEVLNKSMNKFFGIK